MKPHEKDLMKLIPLMSCKNRLEFQQRLQWLSEGMLRNHLESHHCEPDTDEIEQYSNYRKLYPRS